MVRLKSVIKAEEHRKPLHSLSEIDALDDDLHAQYMCHLLENEESSPQPGRSKVRNRVR